MRTNCSRLNIVVLVIVGDSDGVGEDGGEGGEEEPEDADEALIEAVEGEEMAEREAGVEEFVDKEHESQFCLETNFMDEGGQEDTENTAEHEDRNGKKRVFSENSSSNYSFA